ncbi:MAG: hypothetical protein K8T91_26640 [Planctomycetes bacterium]|nr:hypothetical protein [Planctomycetota bacterium]
MSAHSTALGADATMNTPIDNPLRSAAADTEEDTSAEPVRVSAKQDRPATGSRRLQWRPLRQPDSAVEEFENTSAAEPQRLEEPATLPAPIVRKPMPAVTKKPLPVAVKQPSNYRLTAAQQPADEKSVLPALPGMEPEPAPAKTPPAAAPRPYIDPPPGAAAPPPGQLAPMPLPLSNGEPQKLDEKIAYDCKAAREALKKQKLADIDLDIEVRARRGFEVPKDCSLADEAFQPRDWENTDFVWTASGLCHKPLYFEERHLERYGHSTGPYTQPLVSGAHFFGSVLMLPWNMGLKLPGECEYALGHYEPGNCAPYMIPALPITARAALFQAGAAAGLVYLLP